MQRRYGAGTFVAIYDSAVIDWGNDTATLLDRASQLVGDEVFVGAVPTDPPEEFQTPQEHERAMAAFRRYQDAAEQNPDRRRYPIGFHAFDRIAALDITGMKTEFVNGIVVVDGVERRFSEHDYRLLLSMASSRKIPSLSPGSSFAGKLKKHNETTNTL